jgi:hypothetical protein
LPIAPEVYAEAARSGIAILALPTGDACCLLSTLKPAEVYAVLHVIC